MADEVDEIRNFAPKGRLRNHGRADSHGPAPPMPTTFHWLRRPVVSWTVEPGELLAHSLARSLERSLDPTSQFRPGQRWAGEYVWAAHGPLTPTD